MVKTSNKTHSLSIEGIKVRIISFTNNIPYQGFMKPARFKTTLLILEKDHNKKVESCLKLEIVNLKEWRQKLSNQKYKILYLHMKQHMKME